MRYLTVLSDPGCPLCRWATRWLAEQPQLVPLRFVAAGSPEARAAFPELDAAATLREVTVVADTGEVYVGDRAWIACLWALVAYRPTAERLSSPALMPTVRQLVAAVSRYRRRDDGYGAGCDGGACDPHG